LLVFRKKVASDFLSCGRTMRTLRS